MEKIYEKIVQFDLAAYINTRIKKADKLFWCAFFASFIALNLIFIYHGAAFLFGDHDWKYLKNGISLNAGLFEGRFSQFILINLLSQGEILPIVNNVLGFTFFSLGVAGLGRYWLLPQNKRSWIIFALFTAVTPYILSFMYFAFIVAPVLSWNAFIVAALLISERESKFSFLKSASSILLITLALGGYPAVINLIATAFAVRLLIAVCHEKSSFREVFKRYKWTVINIILGIIVYKICLIILTKTGAINSDYYNLQTTPFKEWGSKFLLICKDLFLEFTTTLPFIGAPYKAAISIISLLGLVIILKGQKSRRMIGILLFLAVFLAGMITLFLSTSIRETEFSPRIDFFGFMYGISGILAFILKSEHKIIKNLSYLIATYCIIINAHTLFEAQKVWKLGFDAELSLYKRVGQRFQTDEMFNQYGHYIIVQSGMPTLRKRFYHDRYRRSSDDLLDISYVPTMASGVMWNYYGIYEYADSTSYAYTFRPDADFIEKLQNAQAYPKEGSVAVGGYWILLLMNNDGLAALRNYYLHN